MAAWTVHFITLLTACSVVAYGNYHLRPRPARRRPPPDILTWLTRLDGGTVSVIDAGDGARWVLALHKRAATSVRVWRMPEHVRSESVPRWLGRSHGYVIAAHGGRAIWGFVTNDTHLAEWSDKRGSWVQDFFLFSSRAKMVLSFARAIEYMPSPGDRRREIYHQNGALIILQKYHGISRAIMMRKKDVRIQRIYHEFYADFTVLKDRRVWVGDYVTLKSGLSPSEISEKLERGLYNVNGNHLFIAAYPNTSDTFSRDFRRLGRHHRSFGADFRAIVEVAKSLRAWPTLTFSRKQEFKGTKEDGIQIAKQNILTGRADISAHRFGLDFLEEGAEPLEATVRTWRGVVVVPRPRPLPASTLLLRAFGPAVWAAVAATAVALAFARRLVTGEPPAACMAATLTALSGNGDGPPYTSLNIVHRLLRVIGFLFVAFITSAAYKGCLCTIMVDPERYQELLSAEDVEASGLHVESENTEHQAAILQSAEGTKDEAAVRMVTNLSLSAFGAEFVNESRAWIISEDLYHVLRKLFPDFYHRLSILPIRLGYTMEGFFVRRNLPWHDVLNVRMLRMQESGLPLAWQEQALRDLELVARLRTPSRPPPQEGRDANALQGLWPHFLLLAVGNLGAALILARERWPAYGPRLLRSFANFFSRFFRCLVACPRFIFLRPSEWRL